MNLIFGPQGAPNQPFFRKKNAHFFKKSCFFWTHPNPKSGSPVGPKNGPKNVPEFRHAFKKVYRNPRNVTKNGPAEGSDFDPESEPNSDTQASVTFSKKKSLKIEKIIRRIAIFEISLPPSLTQTLTQGIELLFFFSQTTVRVSFSSPPAGLKIDTFGGPFFDKFLAKNCL